MRLTVHRRNIEEYHIYGTTPARSLARPTRSLHTGILSVRHCRGRLPLGIKPAKRVCERVECLTMNFAHNLIIPKAI